MLYRAAFLIDALPKSLNKKLRAHWTTKHKENLAWDMIIHHATRGKRPKAPLQKAKVRMIRHYYRFLDFDGVVGSLKPVMDALVSSGIVKDDSWDVVGAWEVDQCFRSKSKGPMLEIFIEERPSAILN